MVPTHASLAPLLLTLAFAAAAAPLACGASAKDDEDRLVGKTSVALHDAPPDASDVARRGDALGIDSGAEAERADPAPVSPPPAPPAPTPTPPLRIVHLASDGTEETDGEEERAPRPSLTNASLARHPAPHAPPRPIAAPQGAKRAYDAAMALANAGRHAEARDALTSFLLRWPDSPNAVDALYARGQCDLSQGDFASAARAFDALLARFPSSRRAHDARLALDLSKRHLDDAASARRRASESGEPATPRRQAAPPAARPPGDDEHIAPVEEDNEHIVPVDEDNEHIVPVEEDNEHLVGGRR